MRTENILLDLRASNVYEGRFPGCCLARVEEVARGSVISGAIDWYRNFNRSINDAKLHRATSQREKGANSLV
jgi:hypothetical protein